jgi:hypothetical protein
MNENPRRPAGPPAELPAELERIPPGPELSALLAAVDRGALSARDRIRLARARNRLASHVQSELLADLCAVSGDCAAGGDPPARVRPGV